MKKSIVFTFVVVVVCFSFEFAFATFGSSSSNINQQQHDQSDLCIYKLGGNLEDCNATVEEVDKFNNYHLHPRLMEILQRDYFRYFRVNLYKICQFWPDDARCSVKDCLVKTCSDEDLPFAFQKYLKSENLHEALEREEDANSQCEQLNPLGHLNDTITEDHLRTFEDWKRYDDAADSFCAQDDEYVEKAKHVDLFVNPERYTGYQGAHAHKIWNSIYNENCFKESVAPSPYGQLTGETGTCLEKRVFYRLVSGLHTSINVHLCANFLHKGIINQASHWGPSREQFQKRFSLQATNGQGTQWLKNLYFIYLVELRAIAKAAPYLEREDFYTGNLEHDEETRTSIRDLLKTVRSFKYHFDESQLFKGGDEKEMAKLKEEVQTKFQNITRIMDCVGCDKCRLWGKLQTQALGTALKILFSPKKLGLGTTRRTFQLSRSEIVALINGFGRLSTSIVELENFKELFEAKH